MDNAVLYGRKGTAAMLAISVRSVDYLIAEGRLKTQRVGRRVVVHRKEIDRFARTPQFRSIRPNRKSESLELAQPPVEPLTSAVDKDTDEEGMNG
jgi:excisionase family DNA binding protein